jgi:hypothetical protein
VEVAEAAAHKEDAGSSSSSSINSIGSSGRGSLDRVAEDGEAVVVEESAAARDEAKEAEDAEFCWLPDELKADIPAVRRALRVSV